VDLEDVVRRAGDVVLDQRPSFEHCDLRHAPADGVAGHGGLHVDAHEVATDRTALAFTATSRLEHLVAELERLLIGEDRPHRRLPRTGTTTAATATAAALRGSPVARRVTRRGRFG
jgi:hypothetical protein